MSGSRIIPLYEDDQFIHWISPYFHDSFSSFMNAGFLQPDEDRLNALLNNKLLMTRKDIELSWDAVTRLIMNDLSTLEQYHAQRNNKDVTDEVIIPLVSGLMEYSYIRMICLLPKSRFASLRDELAVCMQNVCIDVFNKRKEYRGQVKIWMDNGILLAVSQEIKNMLTEKLGEMEGILASSENNERSSTNPLKIIAIALFIIIKLATCNFWSSEPTYNYNFRNTGNSREIESLLNRYRDSQAVRMIPPMDTNLLRESPNKY